VNVLRAELEQFVSVGLRQQLSELRTFLVQDISDSFARGHVQSYVSNGSNESYVRSSASKVAKPSKNGLKFQVDEVPPPCVWEPLSWIDCPVDPQHNVPLMSDGNARSLRKLSGDNHGYTSVASDDDEEDERRGKLEEDLVDAELEEELQEFEEEEEAERRRTGCYHFVTSSHFDMAMGLFVLSNAIFIGIETDYMARYWCEELPDQFFSVDIVFTVIFALELMLRSSAEGLMFFCSHNWFWNYFDCIVVGLQIYDTGGQMIGIVSKGKSSPLIRMLRLVRIVRVLRLLRLVKVLSTLLVSIKHTLLSVGWLVLLIFLMTYVFGIVVTQLVTDHKLALGRDTMEQGEEMLEEYFGTLDRSISKLWQAISEGEHWGALSDPLADYCSRWFCIAFMVYMAFVFFAVMNVVTAVVVENALRGAQDEKRHEILHNLLKVFKNAGLQSEITEVSFKRKLHSPEMQAYLEELGLSEQQRHECSIFHLIDEDGSGSLDKRELIHSCMQLTGPAKAINLALLTQEFRSEMDQLHKFCLRIEDKMGTLCAGPTQRPRRQSTFNNHSRRVSDNL